MEEGKTSISNEVASAGYDAAEKPFDFIGTDSKTALICESTPAIKEKITKTLINMGYHVTEPASGREALKSMRFHLYDLIIVQSVFYYCDKIINVFCVDHQVDAFVKSHHIIHCPVIIR